MPRADHISTMAARDRGALAGILLGSLLGVIVTIPPLTLLCGLPGGFVAFWTGDLESGETDLMWMWVAGPVNLCVYAVIGGVIGFMLTRRTRGITAMPECAACGFKWPRPDGAECPQCHARSFGAWAGATLPTFRCEKCRYDLTGNTSGVCPECGTAVT